MSTQEKLTRAHMKLLLAEGRKVAGLTIRKTADAVGVPSSTMQGWLKAEHLPQDGLRTEWEALLRLFKLDERYPLDAWWDAVVRLRNRRSDVEPYLGLTPFPTDAQGRYFGRDGVVGKLTERLNAALADGAGLIIVTGPSGSGKTSLINAGLTLPEGSVTRVDLAAGQLPDADTLVVVVDHGEQIFLRAPAERAPLLARIDEAAAERCVILVLRADYFATALQHAPWAGALGSPVLIPPLTEDEFTDVVRKPADVADVDVDPAVVALARSDIRGAYQEGIPAACLPYLSATLRAAYEHSDQSKITADDYQATGGLAGIVGTIAEESWASIDEEQQASAKSMLLSLVHVDDVRVTRTPPREVSVPPVIVENLCAARILTASDEGVALTHDVILEAWPRLAGWIDDERATLTTLATIRDAMARWKRHDEDPELLLPLHKFETSGSLPARELMTAEERAYVDACLRRHADDTERERQRYRRLRRLTRIITVMAVVASLLAIAFAVATWRAFQSQADAEDQASLALSRQLAQESISLASHDTLAGALVSLVADAGASTPQSRSALSTMTEHPQPQAVRGFAGSTMIAADADGVARAGADGKVAWWPHGKSSELREVSVGKSPLYTVDVFSHQGKRLIAAGGGGALSLVDPASGKVSWSTSREKSTVRAIRYLPTLGQLLVAESTGAVSLVDVATGAFKPVAEAGMDVQGMAVAGAKVALVGDKPQALLLACDAAGCQKKADVALESPALSVAFNADASQLAVGIRKAKVLRFSVQDFQLTPTDPIAQLETYVNAVAYSPTGLLLVGTSAQKVMVFDGLNRREDIRVPAIVTSVAWHGEKILAGSTDGTVRAWSTQGTVLSRRDRQAFQSAAPLEGRYVATMFGGGVVEIARRGGASTVPPALAKITATAIAVSAEGGHLAVAEGETVHLFKVTDTDVTLAATKQLGAGAGLVTFLRFSPDGLQLLVTTEKTLQIHDVEGDKSVRGTPSGPFVASFTSDGKYVIAGMMNNSVGVFSPQDLGTPVSTSTVLGSLPTSMAVHPHEPKVAFGTDDGEVHLLRVEPDGKLSPTWRSPRLGAAAASINFSPDGRFVSAAASDGNVWTWEMASLGAEPYSRIAHPFLRANEVLYLTPGDVAVALSNGTVVRAVIEKSQARNELCQAVRPGSVTTDWSRFVPGFEPKFPCS